MSQSVYNVVIHTNAGIYDPPELETNPSVKSKIVIVPNLWIEKLNTSEAHKIMDACEPKGFNYSCKRQYTQMYSIVRRVSDDQEWDSDEVLQTVIALSRIIHPTTISYEYSAIVTRNSEEEIIRVVPGPVSGSGSEVFVADDTRNWLTEIEINELKKLFTAYQSNSLLRPVSTCLWYYEYCSWQKYIDIRWTLVSTALESIVHTGRHHSTRQFTVRIPKLAEAVGMIIQEKEAEQFYDLRSNLVHSGLGDLSTDNQRLYCLMEELLRRVIKYSIINPKFSAFLADCNQIQNAWPLQSAIRESNNQWLHFEKQ